MIGNSQGSFEVHSGVVQKKNPDYSVRAARENMTELLIARGADVKVQDRLDRTAQLEDVGIT